MSSFGDLLMLDHLDTSAFGSRDALADRITAIAAAAGVSIDPFLDHLRQQPADVKACLVVGGKGLPLPGPVVPGALIDARELHFQDGPFDLWVTLAAGGRVDLLTLLAEARRHLHPGGRLCLLEVFRSPEQATGADAVPFLDQFRAQARRSGFELILSADLPWQVEGREATMLLLQTSEVPGWQVLPSRPADYAALQQLFARCFDAVMNDALWQWKYGDGRGQGMLAWADGRIIGHLGGFERTMMWKGRASPSMQFGDAMVHPDHRGALAYRDIGATFLERAAGHANRYPLAFGLVFDKHGRAQARAKLTSPVSALHEVTYPVSNERAFAWFTWRRVRLPADTSIVASLWSAMRHDLREHIVGVRDAAYLTYRYVQHPTIAYELYLVRHRLSRRPLGVIVLKMEDARAILVDIVASLSQLPRLVDASRRIAAERGKHQLATWIDAAHLDAFLAPGGTAQLLEERVVFNVWAPGPSPDSVRDKWWFMMGDSDWL